MEYRRMSVRSSWLFRYRAWRFRLKHRTLGRLGSMFLRWANRLGCTDRRDPHITMHFTNVREVLNFVMPFLDQCVKLGRAVPPESHEFSLLLGGVDGVILSVKFSLDDFVWMIQDQPYYRAVRICPFCGWPYETHAHTCPWRILKEWDAVRARDKFRWGARKELLP